MSKKLEGNGRWESSRMMLPEHREQYLQRRAPQDGKPVQVPVKEELELIRDFVLLPMMLDIVEKNRRDIELSFYTMKTLFIKASYTLMKLIESDLTIVRKELRDRNIRVFQDELASEGGAIHYRFVCRGYEDRFSMIRDAARAEISVRIARYIAKVCS
ncbi:hypothetical protein [Paenibacillus radicis (ex Gao et al. 2016)]|uniref:Uncharacterized protein n=1 Tax=Paenibacillus radicis (ex Gao et al. 2016) TaxID=1737354 RepID=A0A917HM81_9BACL|nr:hypothetical protein [Paenibacillus radicis (ex Gao et al. 2016)]GGG82961.1 hypothetical protein GCM10010918_45620 [Paenibacillus radicis (ex Gao et al. 2016)]